MSLTDQQTAKLKQALETERARLMGNLNALNAEHSEHAEEESSEQGLAEHEEHLLEEVDGALERMANGKYGICEVSEEEISYDRLEALPWARTCRKHM